MRRRAGGLAARLGLHRTTRAILTYHRVAEPAFDPYALAVAPDRFSAHLEILRERADLVDLETLIRRSTRGGRPRVAVTIDDGYRDTLTQAVPRLREAGIPATVFVATGYLGGVSGFWWDRLAAALASSDVPLAALADVPGLVVPTDPDRSGGSDTLGADGARQRDALVLSDALQPLASDARDAAVAEIEVRLTPRPGARRELHPIMTEDEVRALAAEPLVAVGGHTLTHPRLASLPRDRQRAEIVGGLDDLERITGRRPELFAYPYGSSADYDDDSCAAAAGAGLHHAFTNHHARFDPVGDPMRIPRWSVPPLAPPEFSAWLDRVLA